MARTHSIPHPRWLLLAVILLLAVPACDKTPPPNKAADAQASAPAPAPAGPSAVATLGVPPATEPTITFALPVGDEVLTDAPLMLAFSEPMVALSTLDLPAQLTGVTLTPDVPVTWRWVSTDTVVGQPRDGWPHASAIQVQVATSLATRAGKPLQAKLAWTFQTQPPQFIRSEPPPGSSFVARNTEVLLLFDQPVALAALREHVAVTGDEATHKLPAFEVREADSKHIAALGEDAKLEPGRAFVVHFAGMLPPWRPVTVRVTPGLPGLGGTRATTTEQTSQFSTGGGQADAKNSPLQPFALQQVSETEDPDPDRWAAARLQFTAAVAPTDQTKLLSAVPPVKGLRLSCYDAECSINGEFAPMQTYTFTLATAFEDAHGRRLQQPVVLKRAFGHRTPQLSIDTDGRIMELQQKPHSVAIVTRNLKSVTARAWKVPHDAPWSVVGALQPGNPGYAAALAKLGTPVDLAVKPSTKPDVQERRLVDLDAVLGGKPGRVWLEVASPDIVVTERYGPQSTEGRLFQVTDLHIAAKVAHNESLFWVTSLQSGQPVAGARVELRDEQDSVVWRATTNQDGLATGPGGLTWEQATRTRARRLTAWQGEDAATLDVQEPHAWLRDEPGEDEDSTRGWLFTDKPIYRMAETVQVKGLVRLVGKEALGLPPAGQEVSVRLLDPQGEVATETKVRLSARGTFAASLALPPHTRVGNWQVVAQAGHLTFDKSVQVAVFQTPRVKAELELSAPHVARGDALRGELLASWFSGGPLDAAPVHVTVSGMAEDFEPAGWPAFQFGHRGYDAFGGGGSDALNHEWKGTTDAKGRAVFQVPTKQPVRSPLHVEVAASVRDPNGRDMASTRGFWLHPASALVGVGLDSSLIAAPGSVPVHLVAVDPSGKPQPGLGLTIQAVRREWKSVRVQGMGGETNWETREVRTPAGTCKTTSTDIPVDCTLTVAQPGLYELLASVKDRKGRTATTSADFYATGADVTWGPDEPGERLVADKTVYKVGDTAHILFRNQAPGALALVTEERAGLVRTRLQRLDSASPTLDLPIEPRHAPTIHVSVMAISGRRSTGQLGQDTGAPTLQRETIALHVDPADHRLQVTVKPEHAKLQPGQKATVDVAVHDSAGRPRAAEVTLWAVDEGVLALTGEATPDPLSTLYADVERGVSEIVMMDDLVRRRAGELKGDAGGGGGERSAMRGNLRDVAFWQAAIELSADGKAKHTFTLPDNLTTWRIMAVAVDGPGDFGSGDAQLEASKPLMVQPATPRSLAEGDEVELAATVRNRQSTAVSVTVAVAASGALAVQGEASTQLQLGPQQSTEVRFRAKASAAGAAKVQWSAATQGATEVRDAVEEPVEVASLQPVETVASWTQVTGDRVDVLHKDGTVLGDRGGLRVAVAGTLAAGLEVAVTALRDYPYECTEQLSSRLQGALAVQALRAADAKALSGVTGDLRASAQTWIDRIQSRRQSSGGVALWDGGSASVPATAWALWVLADARAAGFTVDAAGLQADVRWLALQDPAARVHNLAAAAAVGLADPVTAETIFAGRAQLSRDDQLWLAAAFARLDAKKFAPRALETLAPVLADLRLDAEAATLPAEPGKWAWTSAVQRQSLLVEVLTRVAPDHPMLPRLTRWLVRQQGGHGWRTTHDNAWALRALIAQFQSGPVPSGDFQFWVGDKQQLAGPVSRSLTVQQVEVPQAQLAEGDTQLKLVRHGAGPVWLRLDYSYALRNPPTEGRNAGLLVRRQWFTVRGEPVRGPLHRGDQVIVQVEVTSGQAWDAVAIVDRPGAGLEPVDLQFANHDAGLAQKLAALQVDRSARLGVADATELAGREVRFFASLTPGTQVFRYVARASHRGTFQDLGARAEAMYFPDVFGSSGASTIRID